MTKRTIALILALAMIIMLIPISTFAAPAGIAVTNAAGLRRVLTSATGGNYYLAADIKDLTGSSVKVAAGTYILDLNGHKITGHIDGGQSPVILVCGGKLTIKDSVGGGAITHTEGADGSYADAVGTDSGTLTITGGSYSGAYGTWCDGGITNISGGTFTGDYFGAIVHGGTMNVSGGTFICTGSGEETAAIACAPYEGKGSLTISGGSFTSKGSDAVCHLSGNLTISGGTFSGANYGLYCSQRYTSPYLAISGGTFSGGKAALAIFEEGVLLGDKVFSPAELEKESVNGEELFVSGTSVKVIMGDGTGKRSYRVGQFKDVDESKWYGVNGAKTIAGVWDNRLMDGVASDRFGVGTYLTIAQALVVADKIHCEYETGTVIAASANHSGKWYQFFVDYAIEHGIIKAGEFTDYDAYATRAEMVHIFAHCLPDSEFEALTVVEALPDVKESDKYGEEIFLFYRAGILSGSDKQGTFHPASKILREEAAAIFLHVYDKTTRSAARSWFASDPEFNWSRFPTYTKDCCDEILSAVIKGGMTDREKVIAIHDYMVNSYHYDYDMAFTGKSPYGDRTFDYTNLLNYGVGVCEAYMELFSLLCAACGVNCEMVVGPADNGRGGTEAHGWNRVWIDGGWLYVDTTFDDPIYYCNGVLTDHYSDQFLLKEEKDMTGHYMECTGKWLTAV